MTSRDPSQIPVEHLAQLLLECARADATLARRSPANDNPQHAGHLEDWSIGDGSIGDRSIGDGSIGDGSIGDGSIGDGSIGDSSIDDRSLDEILGRFEALPELRREPAVLKPALNSSWPALPDGTAASNKDLEELVAIALTSAQDAEDIARQAHEASLRARRGMVMAIGVAAIGFVIAAGATVAALRDAGVNPQMTTMARQVQDLGDRQQRINAQLADIRAQRAVQEANAAPARPDVTLPGPGASSPPPLAPVEALAPLKATEVRVLPAMPAAPPPASTPTGQASGAGSWPIQDAPAASYAGYPPPPPPPLHAAPVYAPPVYAPHVVDERRWPTYHPPVWRFRPQVIVLQPVRSFINSVQRDVRVLLR